jgi:hypothetical protein
MASAASGLGGAEGEVRPLPAGVSLGAGVLAGATQSVSENTILRGVRRFP